MNALATVCWTIMIVSMIGLFITQPHTILVVLGLLAVIYAFCWIAERAGG